MRGAHGRLAVLAAAAVCAAALLPAPQAGPAPRQGSSRDVFTDIGKVRGPLADWAKRQIFDSPLAERGFFNHAYVNELWRRHLADVQDHSFDLWCLVNLGAWYSHWIEGRKAA